MKRQIVDCSKPIDHPDHTKIIDFTPEEKMAAIEDAAISAAKELEPAPKTDSERLAEVEAKLAALLDDSVSAK